MLKPVYIVSAQRTAVTNSKHGKLGNVRPDDYIANLIIDVMRQTKVDPNLIDDVIIGCATPEAQQGLNIARISLLLAGLPKTIPGFTLNRFCASGLESIATAAAKIQAGHASAILAGGVENMSIIPFGGHNISANPKLFENKGKFQAIAYSMGITAEQVATQFKISREDQDLYAVSSHAKALKAIQGGIFKDEITPLTLNISYPEKDNIKLESKKIIIDEDIGPRADTSIAALAKLKPVFKLDGSVTAGNSSQVSDGAGLLLLADEDFVTRNKLTPLARFVAYQAIGLDPEIMGMGPAYAIPKTLAKANLKLEDIDHIELNEAFASQVLAVITKAGLNPDLINPFGGAIASGHPLGATGAIKTTTLVHNLRRQNYKYGMVTMCVGTGMGAAGIFEKA